MGAEWRADLGRAAADFRDVVWPAIADLCGGGQVIPVESSLERGAAREFEGITGIDWLQKTAHGLRGLAVRVQYGRAFASFTIRERRATGSKTELYKRLTGLLNDEGWLMPFLTIQAYVKDGHLLYACVVKTRELYGYILAGGDVEFRHNPQDGNRFLVIWCEDLKAAGVTVIEVTTGEAPQLKAQTLPRPIQA